MEKSLAYYVTVLHKEFAGYCNRKLQKAGLSQGLLYFILYVGNHPGCSPKELAQALSMDTGHVTRCIAKLEQGGFLRQLIDEHDHRAHVLRLQEKGAEAFRLSHTLFGEWDALAMQELSEQERAQLFSLLGRITETKRGIRHV